MYLDSFTEIFDYVAFRIFDYVEISLFIYVAFTNMSTMHVGNKFAFIANI